MVTLDSKWLTVCFWTILLSFVAAVIGAQLWMSIGFNVYKFSFVIITQKMQFTQPNTAKPHKGKANCLQKALVRAIRKPNLDVPQNMLLCKVENLIFGRSSFTKKKKKNINQMWWIPYIWSRVLLIECRLIKRIPHTL